MLDKVKIAFQSMYVGIFVALVVYYSITESVPFDLDLIAVLGFMLQPALFMLSPFIMVFLAFIIVARRCGVSINYAPIESIRFVFQQRTGFSGALVTFLLITGLFVVFLQITVIQPNIVPK